MGLTDDSLDGSIEGIFAKGEICFVEDQGYSSKRETKLELLAGLLVSRFMFTLTLIVTIIGHATMGASVGRRITTTLTPHDERRVGAMR